MIKEFLNYSKNVRGLAPRTIQEYSKNLKEFVLYASPQGLTWRTITATEVDKWTATMSEQGLAVQTIKERISTLRCFFRWMVRQQMLAENPAQFASTPRRHSKLPAHCDSTLIDKWLAKPAKTPQEATVKVATAIMIDTGLRLAECLGLRQQDFDQSKHVIKVTGKGHKERLVCYGRRTIEACTKYRCSRTDYLFPDVDGYQLRKMMYETLGKEVDRVHPHLLRHTFAFDQLENGMPLENLSVLLGHTNTATTEIYARASLKKTQAIYKQINKPN